MMEDDYPIAKLVRLTNGDDIIADVIEMEDEDGILYMLYNPLKVYYSHTTHVGYLSVSFLPWVFPRICEHQEFTIHAEDVLLVSNVSDTMNKYYWENVTDLVSVKKEPAPEPEEESVMENLQEILAKRTLH
jgi:hypothetical protein